MNRRILNVALTSTFVALVLFLVPLAIAVLTLFQADARATLQREALRAAVLVDPGFSSSDLTELPGAAGGVRLTLYDETGNRVSGTGPRSADAVVLKALLGRSSEGDVAGDMVSVVPLSATERVTGAIRASLPASAVWGRVIAAWAIMVVAAAGALAIGILSARALSRRITRPMSALAEASSALGSGDFSVRMMPSRLAEIDQVATALNSTAVRLGELVERERTMAAQASHQLRTPLSGLRAVLEQAHGASAEVQAAAISVAIERADALNSTIDDMIQLARGPLHGTALDAASLLDAAALRWRGIFAAQGRPLRTQLATDLPAFVGVASAVGQILDALLDNAERHGAGAVVLRARNSFGSVAIDVEDEGGTVAATDDIFVSGVSGAGGSGLGLSLALRLAHDQGGRLLLSERSPHTRFTLVLPASEVTPG